METCLTILYRVLIYLLKSASYCVFDETHHSADVCWWRFSGGGGHTYGLVLAGYTRGL